VPGKADAGSKNDRLVHQAMHASGTKHNADREMTGRVAAVAILRQAGLAQHA